MSWKTVCVVGAALGLVLCAGGARAEEPAVSATATATAPVPTAPATAVAQATPPAAKAEEEGGVDHDKFVGHFAVGYFGITQLPIAAVPTGNMLALTRGNVNAPVIGARYWVNRMLGI